VDEDDDRSPRFPPFHNSRACLDLNLSKQAAPAKPLRFIKSKTACNFDRIKTMLNSMHSNDSTKKDNYNDLKAFIYSKVSMNVLANLACMKDNARCDIKKMSKEILSDLKSISGFKFVVEMFSFLNEPPRICFNSAPRDKTELEVVYVMRWDGLFVVAIVFAESH
jgi:hypothetical protein